MLRRSRLSRSVPRVAAAAAVVVDVPKVDLVPKVAAVVAVAVAVDTEEEAVAVVMEVNNRGGY